MLLRAVHSEQNTQPVGFFPYENRSEIPVHHQMSSVMQRDRCNCRTLLLKQTNANIADDNIHIRDQHNAVIEIVLNAGQPFNQFLIHRLNDVAVVIRQEHPFLNLMLDDNGDDALTTQNEFARVSVQQGDI